MRTASCIIGFTIGWLILGASTVLGQTGTVDLVIRESSPGMDREIIDLRPYLQVFPDTLGVMTLQDVLAPAIQQQFQAQAERVLGSWRSDAGRSVSDYWVKLTIQSELDRPLKWMIHLAVEEAMLYTPTSKSGYRRERTGLLLPLPDRVDRGMPAGFPSLEVVIPPGSTQTLYLRVSGMGWNSINIYAQTFHLTLFSPEAFYKFDRRFRFIHALILGILLAVLIYHLVIFFFRRSFFYLFFSLFIFSLAWVVSLFNGYLSDYFLSGPQNDFLLLHAVMAWTAVYTFHYLFARTLLDLHNRIRWIDYTWFGLLISRMILAAIMVGIVLRAGGWSRVHVEEFETIFLAAGVLHTLFLAISFLAGLLALVRRIPNALVYVVAMLPFVIQAILQELNFQGLIELPVWATIDLGMVLSVLLFSLGIANILKRLVEEKQRVVARELEEKAELEKVLEIDRFKSEFFTNITHEFRSPITLILGMAEQIRKKPEAWARKGVAIIQSNGEKLLRLVDQILELTRLEAKTRPVLQVTDDVIAFLRYLTRSHRTLAESRSIELTFSATPEALFFTYDPDALEQIHGNLLSNALKFTPGGGKVEVACRVEGDQFILSVRDTGTGISKEELPLIFDRFYRASNGRSQKADGFGIGLALTRELVERMNGSLEVSSEQGVGSVFSVNLPYLPAELPEQSGPEVSTLLPAADPGQIPESRPVLLIVEDDADVMVYLKALLEKKYQLLLARDGEQGLEMARQYVPDLLITDWKMPKMDGHRLCAALKADPVTNHIPTILLTARSGAEARIAGLAAGADVFLTKPFNEEELLLRVKKLIEVRESLRNHYRDITNFFQSPDLSKAEGPSPRSEDPFMQELSERVLENLGDPDYGVGELCREMHVSRSQLYRKFSALSDISLAAFIRKLRLHKARELLQTTSQNVTQVSMEVGFKNLSTFSRSFTEEFGQNPSDIRA